MGYGIYQEYSLPKSCLSSHFVNSLGIVIGSDFTPFFLAQKEARRGERE
jgi:hypothetical protein